MRAPIRALACAAALLGGPADAAAQPDDVKNAVKNATAKLAASGFLDPERAPPGKGGTLARSDGSGAVVSEDGFILTTYHLIDKLGPVIGDSVEITAKLGGQGEELTTFVVDARPNIDLLLLKVQLSGPYDHLALGSAYDVGDTDVHTYGFPAEGQHDKTDTSRITSRTVEGGYLWGTAFKLVEGQSGSPVYNEGGELVAIAKGEVNNSGAIIPIDYAGTLIAFLRPPRCRVCFRQANDAGCVGAEGSCSAWSDGSDAPPELPIADSGWSGVVRVGAGVPGTDRVCDLQWKIECR